MQPDAAGASRQSCACEISATIREAPHLITRNIMTAIEPVRNAPVGEEAEQVDVPLVCVRKAIEKDHPERELVQVEQHLAAGLLVEILKPSNQNEIAQKIEEPLR